VKVKGFGIWDLGFGVNLVDSRFVRFNELNFEVIDARF